MSCFDKSVSGRAEGSSGRSAAARRRRFAGRAAALVVGVAIAASSVVVGVAPANAAAKSQGSVLTVEPNTPFSTFNPFTAYFGGDLDVLSNIYPTLTYLGTDSTPKPYLATSWKTSSDKLTWTFTLKKGLKWSDGTPLTAKDVAWTYNLIMSNPAAATANGGLITDFDSVKAPDDTTLVIKTKVPQANMLFVGLAIPIVPQHVWSSRVKNLAKNTNMTFPVVGYGPWKLTGYKADQYATLSANKSFFLGAPKYDTIIDQEFKNQDAAVSALKSGQLNQLDPLTSAQYKALQGTKGITTSKATGVTWTAIEVNSGAKTKSGKPIGNGNPLLKDNKIRRAINFGIDRKTLISKVLNGYGVNSAAYLPQQYSDGWKPQASQKVTFSPSKANAMLDAAGYKKGSDGIRVDPKTGKQLSFRLGIHSDNSIDSQVASYMVGWMKNIGVKLQVQSLSFALLNSNLSAGNWDMLMDRWGTSPDPTYLLSIQTCGTLPDDNGENGNTDSFYCDPAFDKLFKEQTTQFDADERMQTIQKMLGNLSDANADMVLYYADDLSAVSTDTTSNMYFGKKDANGNIPTQTTFMNWRQATPVASTSSSVSVGLVIGIVAAVIVVLLILLFILLRRRRVTSADRE